MLGYRAFFAVPDPTDLLDHSREQLHAWLRGKRYDADRLGGQGLQTLAQGVTGVLLDEPSQDGARTLRTRIVEEKDADNRWTTEFTVHQAGRRGDSWV